MIAPIIPCSTLKHNADDSSNSIDAQFKRGLYTPKHQWQTTPLIEVPKLMAEAIDERTGYYHSLEYRTEAGIRFQPFGDFDDKVNPVNALEDARNFVNHLYEQEIPVTDLMAFASGRKGIHIAARYLLPERDDWWEVFNHAAHHWAHDFPTMDTGIYTNRNLIRAPWSRHAAVNARKKPLPWEMFWTASWEDIAAYTRQALTDSQYADMELLIRECMPTDGPTPAHWLLWSDRLVLDFRRHRITQAAISEANSKPIRPKRGPQDWQAILDETGYSYRERGNHRKCLQLEECPYCGGKRKAYVTKSGMLRCFRTGCEAHEGRPPQVWAAFLGVDIEEDTSSNEGVYSPPLRQSRPQTPAQQAVLELREKLNRIHTLQPGTALLVNSSPGLSKTTATLEEVRHFLGTVVVAAPTKERAQALFTQYQAIGGQNARLLQGRCESNCENWEAVRIVGDKGYLPGKTLCIGCPLFPANMKRIEQETGIPGEVCGYFQQFENKARVTFCTYEQAIYLHDAERLKADLIVLDEDPTRAFMKPVDVTTEKLVMSEEHLLYPVQQFVYFLRHLIANATAEVNEQHAVYRCQTLVDLTKLCADRLKLDLQSLLAQVVNCVENVYDRPGRLAKLNTEQLQRVPPAWIMDLADAIGKELKHEAVTDSNRTDPRQEEEEVDRWNSLLSIHVHNGQAVLKLHQRFQLSRSTPLVILDAYGTTNYYEAILGRPIEEINVQAKTHTKVIHIKLSTSKHAFAVRKEALYRRLDEIMEQFDPERTLIYTHKAQVDEVQARYPQADVEHYWGGRGKDEYRNHTAVVLFGTPFPNPQELYDEARALHVNDSEPILSKPQPDNPRHFIDARLEELRQLRCEGEMLQAAHRLRLVWGEGKEKTVVVMSMLEVPGLPADITIDPRKHGSEKRQQVLGEFVTDCIDRMSFYTDSLAEMTGVLAVAGKLAEECRQRLASTGCLIEYPINEAVKANSDKDSLYPRNRNAYGRDRDAILKLMELEPTHVSLILKGGKLVNLKVWGDGDVATAFLKALLSDYLQPSREFSAEALQAVCAEWKIDPDPLFLLRTSEDAYCSFGESLIRVEQEGAAVVNDAGSVKASLFSEGKRASV